MLQGFSDTYAVLNIMEPVECLYALILTNYEVLTDFCSNAVNISIVEPARKKWVMNIFCNMTNKSISDGTSQDEVNLLLASLEMGSINKKNRSSMLDLKASYKSLQKLRRKSTAEIQIVCDLDEKGKNSMLISSGIF